MLVSLTTMEISSAALKSGTHLANVSTSGFSPEERGFLGKRVGGSLNNAVWFNHCHRATSVRLGEKKARNVRSGDVLSVLTTHNNSKDPRTKQVPQFERGRANPNKVVAIILGGGAGTQLFPLTRRTATPAVPVGGCYRLIDILMSNCINSCINKIFVMTQFNSASLNRHIARTYQGNGVNFRDGFVEVLAATQTPGEAGMKWFQGNADAVRRFLWVFEEAENKDIDNVLILSGDHLYRMDYMDLVQNHIDSNADITLSCAPVTWRRASDFGLMKVDSRGKVIKFSEKPKGVDLKAMQVDTSILGSSPQEQDAEKSDFLASMGIYVFKTDVLLKLLCRIFPFANDFGSEIIPSAVREQNVHAYIFQDYWEDFATIKSFYEANLALTDEFPKFQFYDPKNPFFTSPRSLPPTETGRCKIQNSIIAHGCFLRQCTIIHSLVGERSRVGYGVELKDTLLMGADYYQTESEITSLIGAGEVPIGIGSNTKIRNCIIDKNVKIGKDVVIMNKEGVEEADRPEEGFYIRSGITVVVEKATISDGTVI